MSANARPLVLVSAGDDWLHDYWMRTLTPPLADAGAEIRTLSDFGSNAERRLAIQTAHGLVLGGGEDIAPEHYGSEPSPLLGPLDRERDALELPMAREAFEMDLPVLGICRGMQVMNVCLGGTMYRDAAEHPGAEDHPTGLSRAFRPVQEATLAGKPIPPLLFTHPVRTEPGSIAAEVLGAEAAVNSYHHQHVRDVPAGLLVSAWAPDGVVEAIERVGGGFGLGVQWELQASWRDGEYGLIERFVEAARRRELNFKL